MNITNQNKIVFTLSFHIAGDILGKNEYTCTLNKHHEVRFDNVCVAPTAFMSHWF